MARSRAPGSCIRAWAPVRPRAGVALPACLIALLAFAPAAFAQAGEKASSSSAGVDEPAAEATSGDEPEATSSDAELTSPDEELEAAEPDAYEADDPVEEEPSVEEFLVTARKIEILVPDTTVSVIGFDPEQLRAEGINDIRDLSNFTPSLDIKSAFAASNPTIFIRGVGLDDYNANSVGAVAIYQDGVYMASPAGQLFQFFDPADVGVLRGPQPTLYRNASAGAILVRSAEPTDELDAYLETTYGRFDQVDVEGAVGGPIVPGWLSGRLSGTWGIRDGLTENRCAVDGSLSQCQPSQGRVTVIAPGIDDYTNNVDRWAARGQILFELPVGEGETQWLLNGHGGKNNGRAFQYQHRGAKFLTPGQKCPNYDPDPDDDVVLDPSLDPNCLYFPNLTAPNANKDALQYEDSDGDPFAGDYDIDGPEDLSLWGTNLRGTWSFGEGYELSSLTAYEWHERFIRENSDASPNLLLHSDYGDTAWQVSEQLELRGNWSESEVGEGSWTLGFYYLQEELEVDNFFDSPFSGGVGAIFGNDLRQQYTQKTRYFAPFAFSEYHLDLGCELLPCEFTLTTGIRYNWEFKEFETDVCSFSGSECKFFELRKDSDDEAWSAPGGELSLAWNFRENADLYLKYTRGWKGGHFNGGATSEFAIVTGVDPETIDAYELGLRSHWFDGRLMLNATGFYYDYSDFQVFIVEQTPAGFPIPKLVNAADTLVYGVEVDLAAEPLTMGRDSRRELRSARRGRGRGAPWRRGRQGSARSAGTRGGEAVAAWRNRRENRATSAPPRLGRVPQYKLAGGAGVDLFREPGPAPHRPRRQIGPPGELPRLRDPEDAERPLLPPGAGDDADGGAALLHARQRLRRLRGGAEGLDQPGQARRHHGPLQGYHQGPRRRDPGHAGGLHHRRREDRVRRRGALMRSSIRPLRVVRRSDAAPAVLVHCRSRAGAARVMQASGIGSMLFGTLLLGAACLGCSRAEEPRLEDRWARRFLPFDPEWRRESGIPAAPQRYPRMVIWEVSNYPPGSTPTPEQQRAADDLIERCRAAAAAHGWHDYRKGLAGGFAPLPGPDGKPNPHEHHYRNDAHMLDDRVLDCDRPEYLMYHPRSDGTKELVGLMFFARTPTERGPQIGGPLTVWHFHKWSVAQCMVDEVLDVGWALDGVCEKGLPSHRSAEMMHIWLIDRPGGPFSSAMHMNEIVDMEGIDALFVAPEGDDLELFTAQLGAAIARLGEEDRQLVAQSVSYLVFAFGKGLSEIGVPQREAGASSDPDTRGRMGLLRAAQKRGAQMRLRHFVAMAIELDQLRPDLWAEYESTHETPESHGTGHH